MKALILAGGRGTRLRPLTHTQNKHLLPVGNEPMIYRVLRDVIGAGIHEIIININAGDTSIPEAIGKNKWDATISYIEQDEPNGMMYPIVLAQDLIGDDKFILHAGDNVLSGGLKKYVEEFEKNGSDAHLLVTKVEHPERFGVAVVSENRLVKTVEKPKEFVSDLAVTGIYMYNSCVFKAMKEVKPIDPENKGKAEFFPPPVHQWLVDNGYAVTVTEVTGWWKDTGKPEDLLLANRLVLEREASNENLGTVDAQSSITGSVRIGKNSVVKNSKLTGPISIGEDVEISDAIVGPNTSIGEKTKIIRGNIENSIIMPCVSIINVTTPLSGCILGCNATVTEKEKDQTGSALFVGDDSTLFL
jgi:glucose-1-phosphate thymidylyltransferase